MKSSYVTTYGYTHLQSDITRFEIKKETYLYLNSDYPINPNDTLREMIYVYTDDGQIYRLSSRNVKKYIRAHYVTSIKCLVYGF